MADTQINQFSLDFFDDYERLNPSNKEVITLDSPTTGQTLFVEFPYVRGIVHLVPENGKVVELINCEPAQDAGSVPLKAALATVRMTGKGRKKTECVGDLNLNSLQIVIAGYDLEQIRPSEDGTPEAIYKKVKD